MVSVNYGGWDHHSNIKSAFESQAPQFDVAFARLIRDLDERGLLDTTLVLVSSEFGRTPKINATNGRDHYPRVFSVVCGVMCDAFYDALNSDGLLELPPTWRGPNDGSPVARARQQGGRR